MFPNYHIQGTWSATEPRITLLGGEAEDIQFAEAVWHQPAFSATVTRLIDLLSYPGQDDYGESGPSQHAFKVALVLVREAENLSREPVPGSVSTDSTGGIRVTWRSNGRELRLVCPGNPDQPVYLYQEAPDGYSSVKQDITSRLLANKLAWLAQRRPQIARR